MSTTSSWKRLSINYIGISVDFSMDANPLAIIVSTIEYNYNGATDWAIWANT